MKRYLVLEVSASDIIPGSSSNRDECRGGG